MTASVFRTLLHSSLLLLSLAAVPCMADTPVLGIKEALRIPAYLSMELSPDGKHIAAIARKGEASKLVLMDTATLTPRFLELKRGTMTNPRGARWVNDTYLAVKTDEGWKIIDLDGKLIVFLGGRYIGNVTPDSAGNARILARRYYEPAYVARITIDKDESEVVNFHMPGTPVSWVFDANGDARVVTTISTAIWSDSTTFTHWYRASQDKPWEKLATFDYADDFWWPESLANDQKSLVVHSRQGRDTLAYFRYSLETRAITEMLAGHPTQDIYVPDSEEDGSFRVVVTAGMKPSFEWFDPAWAAMQKSIDAALPDRLNVIEGKLTSKLLIHSVSDTDPGQWLLLDVPSATMRKVASAKPEIDVAAMRPVQIVRYAARDGLSIPAYLTLPAKTGAIKPAVILIHGGPAARDSWTYNAEVQMLAARGYTVLQPQFRGSSGFGKAFMQAGYGQWGLAMQDDISDGVRWLVEQGHADPRRICIYGASYGGYAAMWGLVKTPELYRCGASLAGVSDIANMFKDNSDTNADPRGRLELGILTGRAKTGKQVFDQVSPLKNAARITAPVLLAHGEWDQRVLIAHGRKMHKALKDANKEVEWMILEKEGHGIYHEDNREKFYGALFKLLERTIGPGAPP
ncbi:S9 family peptidase [Massilia antarctica]|uniref:S9 family peptidase n=1 Tax=Massilia antarctica TaxID=2765360 RepID=UPI0006BB6B58|nr:S9 family peptidase [Massilia sp. H27-R4]MCY0911768.1 S9 family peptidase [Massilia sp. H27-R4]CUI06780.1 Prolyl oligopeptidase family protein [Janthinobacterium sp. CG23_2]CUU30566.1 Prolyl oligopeptidase family protein [Janthinobacterium sp. CG23_2]